jgi:hypothetical protein
MALNVVALAFVDPRLSPGTFELGAGGMVDRVEIAEMMSRAAGRPLRAEDTDDVPTEPQDLATMFADPDRHGFHGGNSLVCKPFCTVNHDRLPTSSPSLRGQSRGPCLTVD